MDKPIDTLKVCKHAQHSRILKEEEEMWISSEDLRTDGSSDEEARRSPALLKKRAKKQRKEKAILRKVLEKQPATQSELPTTGSSNDTINDEVFSKMKSDVVHRLSVSEASPGEEGDVGAEESSACSKESDVEALNLENRWRPKRGSLKLPNLVADKDNNTLNEMEGFYQNMVSEITKLKNTHIVENIQEKSVVDELEDEKLFKNLKKNPEIQRTLELINQMNEEIKETTNRYKEERTERLKIQNQMCKEISRNNSLPERNTHLFLELYDFEASTSDNECCEDAEESRNCENSDNHNISNGNFVKRNIELAKQGIMAGCSLTDEEKQHLENLLEDIGIKDFSDDFFEYEEKNEQEENSELSEITEEKHENVDSDNDEECKEALENPFKFSEDTLLKLNDIEKKLEEFTEREDADENFRKKPKSPTEINIEDWTPFKLKKALSDIQARMNKLLNETKEISDI